MGSQMRCGSATLPDGALVGGKVIDPGATGNVLRQLVARTEILETRALVAVSDAIATFRVLSLPRASTDKEVDIAVARELPLDPERISTRWIEVDASADTRVVYAVAWDRALLKNVIDAVRSAGLDANVVELKSAAVSRVVLEPSAIVVDLASDLVEIVLVDRHLPQLWHGVEMKATLNDDITTTLAGPIRSLLRFYKRDRRGNFGPSSPVLISGEQIVPPQALTQLAEMVGQPVNVLAPPQRVPADVRHPTYLTCLGLIMRRNP